jgi:hypothetical protein
VLPRATDVEPHRERSHAPRLAAGLLCALMMLVGGSWAAVVDVASSAVAADVDDNVSVEPVAPTEVTRSQRRVSRPLFSVSRRQHDSRPRLRTRLTLRSQLNRLTSCVPRRGPPALIVT